MSTRITSRALGWLIGLLLFVCWNLQAEKNPTRQSIQFTKSFNGSTPTVDLPPISLTATVGVPFSATLPKTLPNPPGSSTYTIGVTGLPDNGLSLIGVDPGHIVGTPLTSGVMNLTVIETSTASQPINSATTWRAYTITVEPPRPPISLTATVGVPFSATLPKTLTLPLGVSVYSISVTGLPDNGLIRTKVDPGFIVGTPLTSGVMNLTVVETVTASAAIDNTTTWRAYTITVEPPRPPISLTATVGVPFSAALPKTLTNPSSGTSVYTISVTGLPDNGLSFMSFVPRSIIGTPLTSGVMNLTVTETIVASQTIANATTWRAYTITVNPSATSFAITGVNQISCQTISATQRQLTFTPQYVGTTGQPIIFTVYQQLPFTTQPGPYSLNLDISNPLITLIAQQNGVLASYNYQWLAACNTTTTPNRPPTTTGIPNQTAQPGQAYQLTLANYFNDPDGNPLTYIVSGLPSPLTLTGVIISGTPASTGSFPISVTAVDPSGLFVSTNFQLTVNGTTPPTQPFTLVGVTTNGCQNLGGNQWQVTFTPQYTGLTGEQIVMAMTNGVITTQAGPYSQTLSTDKPLLTLIAQQGNTTSSYNYFWLAACNGGARQPASEVGNGLQVKVFGNPVQSQEVEVEISGVIGRWVEVIVLDTQGRSHHQQRLDWPTDGGRVNLPVGQEVGTHLIQVRTEGQVQTVKLIKSR